MDLQAFPNPPRPETAGPPAGPARRGFFAPRMAAPDRVLRPTWLELFFDLVFAAAISSLGKLIGQHVDWLGTGVFVVLFHAVYWIWVNHMVYTSRFETDDFLHRLFTFGLILSATAMAVQIPPVLHTGGVGFVVALVSARGLLMVMHLRPLRHEAGIRQVHNVYFIGTALSTACWIASIWLPAPLRFGLWGAGMAFDLLFPWFDRASLVRFPVNFSHLPERLALFVLIVLGESILAMVDGLSKVAWSPGTLTAAGLACGVAVSLWWAYFSYVELTEHDRTLGTGMPYVFAHLPLIIGLTAIAVALDHFIPASAQATLPPATVMLLAAGLMLWILSFLAIQAIAERGRIGRSFAALYGIAAVTAGLLAACGLYFPPLATVAGIVFLLAGLLAFEVQFCRYELDRLLAREPSGRGIPRITVGEIQKLIASGAPVAWVDVRRQRTLQQIPGSHHYAPDALLDDPHLVLPFDRDWTIATYCT